MYGQIKSILIVGGGTSGWITACILSKHLDDVEITLVESSDIPTIGVGEATIIHLNDFLHAMGLKEGNWMPYCNATYKEGIYFRDFYQKGAQYWHPFQYIHPELTDIWIHKYYKEGLSVDSYFDYCYSNTVRNKNNRIDLESKHDRDKTRGFLYTYHLDAGLFADHLKKFVAIPNGVKHIVDDVTDAKLAEDGSISGIETTSNGTLTAELYVDCSGFKSMLLGGKLQEPYLDYNHRIPNDRAIAVRIPYQDRDREMNPFTSATALDAGWVWNIPLWHRIGTGYVYSSQYKSEDEAELELRRHLGEERVKDLPFHHIRMKIGKFEKTWKKNVVAIGLAGGFIEPLESTGIELAQLGAEYLCRCLKTSRSNRLVSQQLYNTKMQGVYDETADYIQLHYILTDREDTDYWRDQKYSENEMQLNVVGKLFRREASYSSDETGVLFSNTAWNSILIGMRMIPVRDVFEKYKPLDKERYASASKLMEKNFRIAKEQAADYSNGVKNPSHFEFLSEHVYKNYESQ